MAIVTVDVHRYLAKPSVDPVTINNSALSSIQQKVMKKFPQDKNMEKQIDKPKYQIMQNGSFNSKVDKKYQQEAIMNIPRKDVVLSGGAEKTPSRKSDSSKNANSPYLNKSKFKIGLQSNSESSKTSLQNRREKESVGENGDELRSVVSSSLGNVKSNVNETTTTLENKADKISSSKKIPKLRPLNRAKSETKLSIINRSSQDKSSKGSDSPSRFKFLSKLSDGRGSKAKIDESRACETKKENTGSPNARSKTFSYNQKRDKLKADAEKGKSDVSSSKSEKIQASKLTKDSRQESKTSITSLLFDTSSEHSRELMEQLNNELWGKKNTDSTSSNSISGQIVSKTSLSSAPSVNPGHPREFRKYVRMNTAPSLILGKVSGGNSPRMKSDTRRGMQSMNFSKEAMCTNEAFHEIVSQASRANAYPINSDVLDTFLKKVESSPSKSSTSIKHKPVQHASSTNELYKRKISSLSSNTISNIACKPKEKFELKLPQEIKNRQISSSAKGLNNWKSESFDNTSNSLHTSATFSLSEHKNEFSSGNKQQFCNSTSESSSEKRTSATFFLPSDSDDIDDFKKGLTESLNNADSNLKLNRHFASMDSSQVSQGYKSTLKVILDYSDDDSSSTYHTPAGSPSEQHKSQLDAIPEQAGEFFVGTIYTCLILYCYL